MHDILAEGGSDLEPKPEKAHLYDKDYPMWSPEWRQRSMSDYWSGKLARETLRRESDYNEISKDKIGPREG